MADAPGGARIRGPAALRTCGKRISLLWHAPRTLLAGKDVLRCMVRFFVSPALRFIEDRPFLRRFFVVYRSSILLCLDGLSLHPMDTTGEFQLSCCCRYHVVTWHVRGP